MIDAPPRKPGPICNFCGQPGCTPCRLAREDPEYQRHWGLPVKYVSQCAHLGEPTGALQECGTCNGKVSLKLLACSIHGACTTSKQLDGVKCCKGCSDYREVGEYGGAVVRNLLWYCYPRSGNGVWQRNIGQLRKRIRLFNGRRVVAIATDKTTDPAGHVKDLLGDVVHEFIEIPNDPHLREAAAFLEMVGRVQTDDPRHITFYGHAKGVTRRPTDTAAAGHWADVMYQVNLDYVPMVEESLKRFHVCGAFKNHGPAFPGSVSHFHYAGSFYWFRNREVFKRDWRAVDVAWYGSESAPGKWFNPEEGGALFLPNTGATSMYGATTTFDNHILPELEKWKESNRHLRTATC